MDEMKSMDEIWRSIILSNEPPFGEWHRDGDNWFWTRLTKFDIQCLKCKDIFPVEIPTYFPNTTTINDYEREVPKQCPNCQVKWAWELGSSPKSFKILKK